MENIAISNFSRSLEINKRPIEIWEAFIQEKWLNIGKNSKLCDLLICPIPTPCSALH